QEIAQKPIARLVTPSGLTDQLLPEEDGGKPVLAGHEALELAGLAKRVERGLGRPADVEWALDSRGTWLLQARPIPYAGGLAGIPTLSWSACVWSRANFKETMPEVPSPLGLAFLQEFMEHNILRHYRELGCTIPPGLSSVRIIQGRPFINVTLFQSFMAQLRGDPALITEQMGGEGTPFQSQGAPPRLPWWKLLRAGLVMERKIRRAARRAPVWFAEMKRMADIARDRPSDSLTPPELLARLDRLGRRLHEADVTLAIVGGVSQGLQALQFLLARWAGDGWRSLLNTALQGLGDVVTARQILWLRDLAELAREDGRARAFFSNEPFAPDTYRDRLAGTGFLRELDRYLDAFGHRALGESDVMAPRFRERPDYLLGVIRAMVKGPASPRSAEVLRRHEAARQGALQELRRRFGPRPLRWAVFSWWYRRLCRSLALREANRHHLMYFTATVRQLMLLIGQHFVTRGILASPDDVFFLTPDEMRTLVVDHGQDWKGLISGRRSERARNEALSVPDVAGPGTRLSQALSDWDQEGADRKIGTARGLPISAGYAEGPARLLLRPEDAEKVRHGDILVVPVIDPGMAPLFGLAAGLIVEMGGTLSHGAIIAREYGIPAIANIPRVTLLLRDGERVAVDASLGVITRLSSGTVSR
ncbi:MAG: PEP-utilizing enzyme, partial [Nitrospiraceae bacterium]